MSSLIYLVPLALLLGGAALVTFLWCLRNGQYEDLDGAAERIFLQVGDERTGRGPNADAENRPRAGGSPPPNTQ